MFTLEAFCETVRAFGLACSPTVFLELVAAYSAADRHYHDARHIGECLALLRTHQDLAIRMHEIGLAVWFHDAVYDTHRSDNEEQSAGAARRFLKDAGASEETIERIEQLILATKHTTAVTDTDGRLLVDIDLAILGQAPQIFAKYDAAIRREYAWVTEEEYRAGRTKVLLSFVKRPAIYQTERFISLYERQARDNIHRAISLLNGGA